MSTIDKLQWFGITSPKKAIIFYKFNHNFIFFKILFIFRDGGREGERRKETSMSGCLSHAPYWGPGLQPRHVPWLGVEPETLWFAGQHSIHGATPATVNCNFNYKIYLKKINHSLSVHIWHSFPFILPHLSFKALSLYLLVPTGQLSARTLFTDSYFTYSVFQNGWSWFNSHLFKGTLESSLFCSGVSVKLCCLQIKAF